MKTFREIRKERLDELSKETLNSYLKKAAVQKDRHEKGVNDKNPKLRAYHKRRFKKRVAGINAAKAKISKAKPIKKATFHKKDKDHIDLWKRGVYDNLATAASKATRSLVKHTIHGVRKALRNENAQFRHLHGGKLVYIAHHNIPRHQQPKRRAASSKYLLMHTRQG